MKVAEQPHLDQTEPGKPAELAGQAEPVGEETESDTALMLRYRDGDVDAFATLYQRHKGTLYRYFLRQCSTPAQAEELFQEVWLHLIRSRKRYEVRAKFTTYLFRMAHNRLVDAYRRQAHRHETAWDANTDPPTDPLGETSTVNMREGLEHQIHVRQQAKQLMTLLTDLPLPQREAFLLREESGMSLEEIAETTQVNRETAKSRVRYAIARLRRGLRDAS